MPAKLDRVTLRDPLSPAIAPVSSSRRFDSPAWTTYRRQFPTRFRSPLSPANCKIPAQTFDEVEKCKPFAAVLAGALIERKEKARRRRRGEDSRILALSTQHPAGSLVTRLTMVSPEASRPRV